MALQSYGRPLGPAIDLYWSVNPYELAARSHTQHYKLLNKYTQEDTGQ